MVVPAIKVSMLFTGFIISSSRTTFVLTNIFLLVKFLVRMNIAILVTSPLLPAILEFSRLFHVPLILITILIQVAIAIVVATPLSSVIMEFS